MPYNPETFKCSHKKFGTHPELKCWLIVERFLVCHPKTGGVLGRKVALEYLLPVNKHNTHNYLLLIK